jgi:hypothetical protein
MGRYRHYREKIEKAIGRKLTDDEVVHHRDRNPDNNRLVNLMVVTKYEHYLIHKKSKDAYYKYIRKKTAELYKNNQLSNTP